MTQKGFILVLTLLVSAAYTTIAGEWYVLTSGDDAAAGTSWATALRTIDHAVNTHAANGDTIWIGAGDYAEYVRINTKTNLTIVSQSNAVSRAFRVETPNNTFSGITLEHTCNAGFLSWQGSFFVYEGGHYTTVTNCKILNMPWAEATNWLFDHTNNTITSTSVDLLSAGFADGCRIYANGVSYTNPGPHGNLRFANQGMTGFATNVTSNSFVGINPPLSTETNSSVWAIIQAGSSAYELQAFRIEPGGDSPTNILITGCTISNKMGRGITVAGRNMVVTNCDFAAIYGNEVINYSGANILIASNHFHDCLIPAYYDEDIVDHSGGNFYDYYVRFMLPGIGIDPINTNIHFIGNWFENIEGANIDFAPPTGDSDEFKDIFVRGNVFVGIGGPMDFGSTGMRIESNTWYRCNYFEGQYAALGGGSATFPMSNVVIAYNLTVSCGSHKFPFDEGYISPSFFTNPITIMSNYVAGLESAKWNSMSGFPTLMTNGVNGGDPMFVNEWNPKGDDGIPFTADDGLRLRPGSPASGIGALGIAQASATVPLPYFRPLLTVASNYYDFTSPTQYNFNWYTGLVAFTREGWPRPHTTADPWTNIPQVVQFDASNSISGTWSTNNWIGIRDFVWDFGDGSRPVWTKWPYVRHTFLVTGQTMITLTVTNSATNIGTFSKKFRVLPGTNFAGDIYYVSTNGNDANTGTYASPFRWHTNAINLATPGDYICILPGDYRKGKLDFDALGGESGTAGNPITFVGYDAMFSPFSLSLNYWTFEGVDISSTNTLYGDHLEAVLFHLPFVQNDVTIRNSYLHDSAWGVDGITCAGAGANYWNNIIVQNCLFTRIYPNATLLNIHGTNIWIDANITINTGKEDDFVRLKSVREIVSRNYTYGLGRVANHSDWAGFYGLPNMHIVFEQNWIEQPPLTEQNDTNCPISFENSGSLGDVHEPDFTTLFTNHIFANNVFINLLSAGNPCGGDGRKYYNNLWLRCGTQLDAWFVLGGNGGSAIYQDFRNNAFVECGATTNSGWYYNFHSYFPDPVWLTNIAHKGFLEHADFNFVCHSNGLKKREWFAGETCNNFSTDWKIPAALSNSCIVNVTNIYPRFDHGATEANGINGGNPGFISSVEGIYDLRLTNGSMLIGKGTNLSTFGYSNWVTGTTQYFTKDFFGNARPSTTNWTIGPFEGDYTTWGQGGGDEELPASSTNRVQVQLRGNQAWRGSVIIR